MMAPNGRTWALKISCHDHLLGRLSGCFGSGPEGAREIRTKVWNSFVSPYTLCSASLVTSRSTLSLNHAAAALAALSWGRSTTTIGLPLASTCLLLRLDVDDFDCA